MAGEIILNLDSPEYQDEFSSFEEGNEQNGLWQQDANKSLVKFLNEMGEEAKHYKSIHIGKDIISGKFSSYHHAIFISGERGTGKTVFLRNAKDVWNRQVGRLTNAPSLHFIDVIDPTLLNIDDRFSEVIIATVYASVDKALKRPDISQERKDNFYSSLKNLSGALGLPSEFDEFRGIDRIQKYRSGIHIEHYFHQFLIASVELLNCDALVLPIDDVDMKIDHAFGVLDDIRCLLSCPLILPLVSGDGDLYRHITTMRFEESLAKNKDSSNFIEGKTVAERLSNAYLTKVFPNHVRLPLVPINQLLSKLKIKYKNSADNSCNEMKYSEYEERIKDVFYPLCNGQERSTDWPQPDSAREITQFTRLLTPIMLDGYGENKERLWRNFSVWAEEKQDGIALTNAESFLMINSMQSSDELDLKKVIAFNPLIQKGNYQWAKKNYYAQQVQCISDLKAYKTNTEILDTVFDNQNNNVFLKSNNILRSLPPLELIMDPMYVRKNIVEGSSGDNNILIAMYTHNNYYSRQRNRRYHVFFSRAFEILFWSCLVITENISDDFMDERLFNEKFKNIFYRVPFYSSFSFNSTKIIDESNDGDSDDFERSMEYSSSIDSFMTTLYEWCKNNKLSELKGKNLVPLLSLVFNKVFTQLKVLRSNILTDRKTFNDEHLSDLAKRFEYIFINSLTSFVRDGVTINANVATGAKSSSVRSYDEFTKYDRTLYRNLSGIIADKADYESITIPHRLINVMREHPVFNLINTVSYPIGEMRSTAEYRSDDVNFNEMNFYGIRNFYYSVTGKKTIRTSEVKQWAAENPDVARKIHSRIKNDSDMYLDIYGNGQVAWMFAGLSYGLGIEY